MNGQPHLHRLEVRTREYGSVRIVYGDTSILVKKHWWQKEVTTERVQAGIVKAVQQHDEGSRREQQLQDLTMPINRQYGGLNTMTTWGEDLILGRGAEATVRGIRSGDGGGEGTVLRPSRFTNTIQ